MEGRGGVQKEALFWPMWGQASGKPGFSSERLPTYKALAGVPILTPSLTSPALVSEWRSGTGCIKNRGLL